MEATYAVIAFLVVAGVTGGVALLAQRWDPVATRLRRVEEKHAESAGESILRWDNSGSPVPTWRRTLEKWGHALLGKDAETRQARQSALQRRLVWAGFDNPRNVQIFLGTKLALGIGAAYSYTMYGLLISRVLPQVLPISIVFGIVGFFLPDFWLSQRIKERQRLMHNALPDMLDLLVVCVEAGLGLDAAIAKVTDPAIIKGTPLETELRRVHLEFRAGRPRAEALRALGERTGVDEVRMVVSAFVQTEKLGTSLADTLRVHADAARIQRRHRAEKAAYLAPLKMLFPIVGFLFPSIFVVTVAPALLKIMYALRGLIR